MESGDNGHSTFEDLRNQISIIMKSVFQQYRDLERYQSTLFQKNKIAPQKKAAENLRSL